MAGVEMDVAASFEMGQAPPEGPFEKKGTFASVYKAGHTTGTRSFIGRKSTKPGRQTQDNIAGDDGPAGLTVNTASFNLANNIVGAGLVGLSFVANSAGLIPFLVFMLVAGYCSILTLDMLTANANMTKRKDYELMAASALGVSGRWITSASIVMQCYGACIAYLVLIATTAPVLTNLLDIDVDTVYLQIGITLAVVLPMCCLKDLSALSCTAIVALLIYLAVAVYVIYRGFTDTWYTDVGRVERPDGSNATACPVTGIVYVGESPASIVKNLPTIIFAYVCHQCAPPVYAELSGGKLEDMNKVNRMSIYMAGFLYICVGTSGYLAYTNNTFGAVLQNLRHCVCDEWSGDRCASSCAKVICADDDVGATAINAGFLFAVLTGFPSVHYALRKTLINMFCAADATFSWTIHIGLAVANVVGCLIIAVAAADVSVVFNWAGSIASPMVSYIMPSLIFLILLKSADRVFDTIGVLSGRLLLAVGTAMMFVGVALNVLDAMGIPL